MSQADEEVSGLQDTSSMHDSMAANESNSAAPSSSRQQTGAYATNDDTQAQSSAQADLSQRELAQMMKFAQSRTDIEAHIERLRALPVIDAFDGFTEVQAGALRLEEVCKVWANLEERCLLATKRQDVCEEVQESVSRLETGDIEHLRALTKAAIGRNLSADDTDLLELAIHTLSAFDTLARLLMAERRYLSVVHARLDWETQRKRCWTKYIGLRRDLDSFITLSSRFSSMRGGVQEGSASSTKDASTSPSTQKHAAFLQIEAAELARRCHALLSLEIPAADRLLNDLMDQRQVPDALLDEQDRLDDFSELVKEKLIVITRLSRQWKWADRADDLTKLLDKLNVNVGLSQRNELAAMATVAAALPDNLREVDEASKGSAGEMADMGNPHSISLTSISSGSHQMSLKSVAPMEAASAPYDIVSTEDQVKEEGQTDEQFRHGMTINAQPISHLPMQPISSAANSAQPNFDVIAIAKSSSDADVTEALCRVSEHQDCSLSAAVKHCDCADNINGRSNTSESACDAVRSEMPAPAAEARLTSSGIDLMDIRSPEEAAFPIQTVRKTADRTDNDVFTLATASTFQDSDMNTRHSASPIRPLTASSSGMSIARCMAPPLRATSTEPSSSKVQPPTHIPRARQAALNTPTRHATVHTPQTARARTQGTATHNQRHASTPVRTVADETRFSPITARTASLQLRHRLLSTSSAKGPNRYRANPKSKLDVAVGKIVNDMAIPIAIAHAASAKAPGRSSSPGSASSSGRNSASGSRSEQWHDESGRYWLGHPNPKLCFCRILRSKTVMVRIGGGWEELSGYIDKHYAHLASDESVSVTTSPMQSPAKDGDLPWLSSLTMMRTPTKKAKEQSAPSIAAGIETSDHALNLLPSTNSNTTISASSSISFPSPSQSTTVFSSMSDLNENSLSPDRMRKMWMRKEKQFDDGDAFGSRISTSPKHTRHQGERKLSESRRKVSASQRSRVLSNIN
jgi:uncharacterized protein YifE (UPF0438 family)